MDEVLVLVLRRTGDWDQLDFCHQGFVMMSLFFQDTSVNYSWKRMSTGTTDQCSCIHIPD